MAKNSSVVAFIVMAQNLICRKHHPKGINLSNWKMQEQNPLNVMFATAEKDDQLIYPNLDDGSHLVLASDYSGEHKLPEFRVLSFLITTRQSIDDWDDLRLEVRQKHLSDGRRMSFKDLNDALRINALPWFLDVASRLNGLLVCVGVEKGYSFSMSNLPDRLHNWSSDSFNKLLEICIIGGALVDGLRSKGQNLHWITDDDAIVSNENAVQDSMKFMGERLHKYDDEYLQIGLGIASKFDDNRRAEDLIAIPDLAGGAFCESITSIGKANIPTSGHGVSETPRLLQIKSTYINSWRSELSHPLKHMNAIIRPFEGGKTLISFGSPFCRVLRPGESADGAHFINARWRRSLERYLRPNNKT